MRTSQIAEQQCRSHRHSSATSRVVCSVPPIALPKQQHWGKRSLPPMSHTDLLAASSFLSFLIWRKKKCMALMPHFSEFKLGFHPANQSLCVFFTHSFLYVFISYFTYVCKTVFHAGPEMFQSSVL